MQADRTMSTRVREREKKNGDSFCPAHFYTDLYLVSRLKWIRLIETVGFQHFSNCKRLNNPVAGVITLLLPCVLFSWEGHRSG